MSGTAASGAPGGAASTAQPPSCSLLAQVATTTWLDMAGSLTGRDGAGLDAAAARLADIVSIHGDLGCDTAALRATTDCLLDRAGTASPRALARTCLTEAGILEE